MNRNLLLVLTTIFISRVTGTESITLSVDQAVERAVIQNLELQQKGIDVRTRERIKKTAWNILLPSMKASAGYNIANQIFTNSGNAAIAGRESSAGRFTTGINFDLLLNSGIGAGINNLIAEYEVGLLNYENAQKKLERDVRKQFYLLLGNQENIRIQRGNIKLAEKRLTQTRKNFKNGLVPELEVLSAEVTVANLQPVYNNTVATYDSLMLFFKFLLGEDRNTEITLDGNLKTDLYNLDSELLINNYMAGRLDIRRLNKQIEAMEYMKKGKYMQFNTPVLNLGYNYSFGGSSNTYSSTQNSWSDWQDNGTFSLTLHWKFDGLIPGSKTNVQLKNIQDNINSLNLSKQIIFDHASIEITNLVNKLNTSRKTIEANTSSVELARRNYQLTEEAYNVGTRELLDVESRQQDYLKASQQLLLAKYAYISGLLDLEYALNVPMEEFLSP